MRYTSPQRGVALLLALLVVALAAVLIAALLDRGELIFARTRNALRLAQAQAYAQGLEAYAARVLQRSAEQGGSDSSASAWAVPLAPTPVAGGEIAATMRDRNGCFNLNNLLDASGQPSAVWQPKFTRLLNALKLDPALTRSVVEWLATGSAAAAGDGYYLGQSVPYRAAQRDFVHVSELRLVRGVSGAVYTQLAPHVCALPRGSRVNLNTASVPVLMTLFEAMTEEQAQRVWQQGHANFASLADVAGLLGKQPIDCGGEPPDRCYDVRSTYFLARAQITLDGLPFTFFSLIENRSGPGGGIRVIQRSRGED